MAVRSQFPAVGLLKVTHGLTLSRMLHMVYKSLNLWPPRQFMVIVISCV